MPARSAVRVLLAAPLVLGLALLAPVPAGAAESGVLHVVVVEGEGQLALVATGGEVLTTDSPLPTGTPVRFTRDGDRAVRVQALAAARAVAGAPSPVVHDVELVMALGPGQAADPRLTVDDVRATLARVDAYWRSQTGGVLSYRLSRVVNGTTRLSRPCSDRSAALKDGAKAAGHSALSLPRARHVLVVTPQGSGCGGFAVLGSAVHDGGVVVMEAERDRKPGSAGLLLESATAHELGHNAGLNHAGAVRCSGQMDPRYPALSGCESADYGDPFDVMGASGDFGNGSLNVLNRATLGLADVLSVTGSGVDTTLTLDSLSLDSGQRHGLAVTGADGQTYFAEYRTNWGRDADWGTKGGDGATGVRVLRPRPDRADGTFVLDLAEDASSFGGGPDFTTTLQRGATFVSNSGGVRLSVVSEDARAARVRVQTAPFADAAGPAPQPRRDNGSEPARQDPAGAPAPSYEPRPQEGAPPAPRLTLDTAAPVGFGTPVVVTIQGAPGATVELFSRLFPNSGFTRIRNGLVLGPDGTLDVETRPNYNLRLMAKATRGGALSNQPLIQVRKVVSLSSIRGAGPRRLTVSGSAKPVHPGQVVQIRRGTTVLGSARTAGSGAYSVTVTVPAGTSPLTAVSPRTGYNEESRSGTVTVSLRS